jgi:hypothetical protein
MRHLPEARNDENKKVLDIIPPGEEAMGGGGAAIAKLG